MDGSTVRLAMSLVVAALGCFACNNPIPAHSAGGATLADPPAAPHTNPHAVNSLGVGRVADGGPERAPSPPIQPGASPADHRSAVGGALPRAAIKHAVAAARQRLRACYETALRSHPHATGRVLVHWTVAADGSVSQADVRQTTLHDAKQLERCLVDEIRTWRFPKPAASGRVDVTYPFVFHAD